MYNFYFFLFDIIFLFLFFFFVDKCANNLRKGMGALLLSSMFLIALDGIWSTAEINGNLLRGKNLPHARRITDCLLLQRHVFLFWYSIFFSLSLIFIYIFISLFISFSLTFSFFLFFSSWLFVTFSISSSYEDKRPKL